MYRNNTFGQLGVSYPAQISDSVLAGLSREDLISMAILRRKIHDFYHFRFIFRLGTPKRGLNITSGHPKRGLNVTSWIFHDTESQIYESSRHCPCVLLS